METSNRSTLGELISSLNLHPAFSKGLSQPLRDEYIQQCGRDPTMVLAPVPHTWQLDQSTAHWDAHYSSSAFVILNIIQQQTSQLIGTF